MDAQAQWERFLRTSGILPGMVIPPEMQTHLQAQFAAWQRRQAVIGKTILAVVVTVVLLTVLIVVTTMVL